LESVAVAEEGEETEFRLRDGGCGGGGVVRWARVREFVGAFLLGLFFLLCLRLEIPLILVGFINFSFVLCFCAFFCFAPFGFFFSFLYLFFVLSKVDTDALVLFVYWLFFFIICSFSSLFSSFCSLFLVIFLFSSCLLLFFGEEK
jgi:hypothetical protein